MEEEFLLAILKEKAIINFDYKCRIQSVGEYEIELSVGANLVASFEFSEAGARECIRWYRRILKN